MYIGCVLEETTKQESRRIMVEPKFETPITDTNGDVWTPNYDYMAGSYYWDNDDLPENVTVYCSPFFDGCEGIPLEILTDATDHTDVNFTMFEVSEDCDLETELAMVLAMVKTKIN